MNIDLSRLENLASKTPFKPLNGGGQYKTSAVGENAVQGKIESIAAIKLNREQEDHAKMLAVYREHQENIKKSGQLTTEILKGVKLGESSYTLLLKAVKAISLMTGTELIFTQVMDDLRAIYGAGMLEKQPLEDELQEVMARLERLEQAEKREGEPPDSRRRIRAAVTAHRARAEELQRLIKKGENEEKRACRA